MRYCIFILLVFAGFSCFSQEQPLVQFGDFKGYGVFEASVAQIIAHPVMKSLDKKCKIISFDIYGIVPTKQYIGPYRSEGAKMTDAQIRYVKSLGPGANLWINNIHIKCKDGEKVIGGDNNAFGIYFFNITK
ncbi:MAG: hypothetical protein JST82_02205 [Bacteroidetes bacterium]|nr:hypothetical protein [Bacteroidota bacterium]